MHAKPLTAAYATAALVLAAWFVLSLLAGGFRAIERSDYVTYHLAGRIVLEGHGACLYDSDCQAAAERALIGDEPSFQHGALPFNSPATVALLAVPFAALSLPVGFGAWTLLSLALLALAAWRLAWGGWLTRATSAALVLSAWPTAMAAVRGQLSIGVAAMLGLSAATLAGDTRGILAGLGSIKPTLVPLYWLWFAVARRWRDLLWAAAVVLTLMVVALVVVGPKGVFAYPGYVLRVGIDVTPAVHPEQMVNWRGVAVRLDAGTLSDVLFAAGTIATLGIVGVTWWWVRPTQSAAPIAVAAAFVATPLVIPHANQHEALLAGLGVLILLAGVPRIRSWLAPVAVGLHALLWLGPILSQEGSATLLFAVLFALLLLIAVVARQQGRQLVPAPSTG